MLGSEHTESLEEKINSKGNVFFLLKKKKLDRFPCLLVESAVLGKLGPVKALLGTSNRYVG